MKNMSNLTIKQKIILGIIICIMLVVIGIYGYTTLNQDEELEISGIQENVIDIINMDENIQYLEENNQNSRK